MKYYAIFHDYIATRSVLRLDGRLSISNMRFAAESHAKRFNMTEGSYTIERGLSLSNTFAITLPKQLQKKGN